MKTFKKILLMIVTSPFFIFSLFATLLLAIPLAVIIPFMMLVDWLKDDWPWTVKDFKLFYVPVLMYLDTVWDRNYL